MLTRAVTPRASWFSKYVPLAGSGCVLFLPGQDDPQKDEIRDISGQRNNGAITGASWVKNPWGLWVLEFDGDDDVIVVDNSTDFTVSTGFTLCEWFYITNYDAARYLMTKRASILHKVFVSTDGKAISLPSRL